MIGINDVVDKLVEDVFIRGIDLSQPFKPMTDNELTIEELKSVSGGLVIFYGVRGDGPKGTRCWTTTQDWLKSKQANTSGLIDTDLPEWMKELI